jgi:hypothetical protein
MNQAEALYRIGFTVTEWWDISNGYPGVYHAGVFDPTKNDTLGRYGVASLSALRYDPNNYTGSHASGLNPFAMDGLAAVLTDAVRESVILDGNALADMDMLRGATAMVVGRALALGLLAPASPSGPVTPPVTPGNGDAATIASLTKQLTAAEAEVAKDDVIFGGITNIVNKALDTMGPRGGGAPIAKARASFKAILAALS